MRSINFSFIFYIFTLLIIAGLIGCDAGNKSSSEENGKDSVINQIAHPEWSYDDTIYELNVRQFSQEGTFKAVTKRVPELKELGVDIVWIMPVHPIGEVKRKGELGSYYAVKDYKAVNPEFGTMEDFKELVQTIHEHDMYVLLDWVANHTAWDHKWTRIHPEFYTTDIDGNFVPPVEDWSDVIDLNFDNILLREKMMDAMKFWVEEADIDGYRCDVAGMVPMDFWQRVRTELDTVKTVFMLAEDESPKMHDEAFDMTYGWEFHHLMNSIATGEKNISDILDYLEKDREQFPENAFRMNFITNHDENSWNGTVFERLGEGSRAFAVLTFTMEGMPLIYSGQEAGMKKRLEFFQKDPIDWTDEENFRSFYKTLTHLKENNPALYNGNRGGLIEPITNSRPDAVFTFIRQKEENKVFVILNLSDNNQVVSFESELATGNYENIFSGDSVNFQPDEKYTLPLRAWEYRIMTQH